MGKKKNKAWTIAFAILIVVALGIFVYNKMFSLITPIDDYNLLTDQDNPTICQISPSISWGCTSTQHCFPTKTCEFSSWSGLVTLESDNGLSDYGKSQISGTELHMKLEGDTYKVPVKVTTKDTFKGRLFRQDITIFSEGTTTITYTMKDKQLFITNIIGPIQTPSSSQPNIQTGLFELIPDFLDSNLVTVKWQGIKKAEINLSDVNKNESFITVTVTGNYVLLENSRFKYEDGNCKIEDDEFVVSDEFYGAGCFNIIDFDKPVNRFCSFDYPAVKRSLIASVIISDITGTTTQKLAHLETICVPENTILSVPYITDFVEGIGEKRCNTGEYWSLKNKTCTKLIWDKPDVIETIRDVKFIEKSSDQITFKNSIDIGSIQLVSSNLEYTCDKSSSATISEVTKLCWSTTVNYKGKDYKFTENEQLLDLDQYFSLQFYPDGSYDEGTQSIRTGWSNNFVLSVKDRSFLTIIPVTKNDVLSDFFTLPNKIKNIDFILSNKLTNFADTQSGINIKITKYLNFNQVTSEQPFAIAFGNVSYKVVGDSTELGEVLYEITPFVKIDQNKIVGNQVYSYNYKVVTELPGNVTVINDTIYLDKIIKEYVDRNITILVNTSSDDRKNESKIEELNTKCQALNCEQTFIEIYKNVGYIVLVIFIILTTVYFIKNGKGRKK